MSDSDEVKKLKEKVDSLEELARKNDAREEEKLKVENSNWNLVIIIPLFIFGGVWIYLLNSCGIL